MKKNINIIAGILFGLASFNANAISFKEAIYKAYAESNLLKSQIEDNKSYKTREKKGYLKFLPTAEAKINKIDQNYSSATVSSTNDKYSIRSVSVNQNIFNGGQTLASLKQAKFSKIKSDISTKATESQIIYNAASTYLNYLSALEMKDQADIKFETLNQIYESTKIKFSLGEVTSTDVSQAQARLSDAITNRYTAIANLDTNRDLFINIVGINPENLEKVDYEISVPQSLSKALEIAELNNTDILADKINLNISKEGTKIAYGQVMPSVDVSLNYKKDTYYGTSTKSAVASVNIPIFNQGVEYANIFDAQYQESKQSFANKDNKKNILEEVRKSWTTYQLTKQQIYSAKDAVKAAELAFAGIQEEAKIGLKTNIDVLNAEQDLHNYRVVLIQNKHKRIISALSLIKIVGKLNLDFIDRNQI